jgi:4-diphosphocytidyl-2-C-methyl-D-erythritol kinase
VGGDRSRLAGKGRRVSRSLRLLAPAKINWTLEVLRLRPDGYHEIRSVLQTIDLCDVVTVTAARDIDLHIDGEAGTLADEAPEANLAYRAAVALRERCGVRAGASIMLMKRAPIAAGMGGGSSDAAAVLRALNELWETGQSRQNLMEIAGEIGSDPPFFLDGGTAAVSKRGDHVEPLRDALAPPMLLATPPAHDRGRKTAAMFAALTPAEFSDGYVTIGVRETVEAGRPLSDEHLNNVFERVLSTAQPATELAMDALRAQGLAPHLAGAGPAFFLLLRERSDIDALSERVRGLGFEPRPARTLSRHDALRTEEA